MRLLTFRDAAGLPLGTMIEDDRALDLARADDSSTLRAFIGVRAAAVGRVGALRDGVVDRWV